MQSYRCPGCGSEITVTDTMLYEDSSIDLSVRRVRIDTAIVHKDVIVSPDCVVLFRMFAEDQQAVADNMLKRAMERFPKFNSQETQG